VWVGSSRGQLGLSTTPSGCTHSDGVRLSESSGCLLCPQMMFWLEMCESSPSLTTLDQLGADYDRCARGAEAAYHSMLRLDRNSVSALRAYAQFLIEVWWWWGGGGAGTRSVLLCALRTPPCIKSFRSCTYMCIDGVRVQLQISFVVARWDLLYGRVW
jgi:hypothetical protein